MTQDTSETVAGAPEIRKRDASPDASTSTSFSSPSESPAPGERSTRRFADGKFKNKRDQWLYYCSFFPDEAEIPLRGVVLFLHGIGEYARRFSHVFEELCSRGFGVVAYDLVGHGRSDDDEKGQRAHAASFQHFVDDTNTFVALAKQDILPRMLGVQMAPLPLIFMGMSYGSLVGLHTVLAEEHTFDAVVMAAPALSVEWTATLRLQRAVLTPVTRLLPHIRATPGVNHSYLSRNPAFVADYMSDPMVTKDKLTIRMATESLAAMEKIQHEKRVVEVRSPFCRLPLLIVQGSEDKITSVPLAEAFYQRVASRDKEFKKFRGLYHCLFNEPERDEVMGHICEWLTKRFGVLEEDEGSSSPA